MNDIESTLGGEFLPQSIKNSQFDGTPIPPGVYETTIRWCEVKPTKTGTGKYLAVDLVIDCGEYVGRHLFENITLANPNAKAVEIGMRELASFARAAGLSVVKSSGEFIGRKVAVRVAASRTDDSPRNEIKAFLTPQIRTQATPAPVAKPTAPVAKEPIPSAAQPTQEKPLKPWLKKQSAQEDAQDQVDNFPF